MVLIQIGYITSYSTIDSDYTLPHVSYLGSLLGLTLVKA